MLVADYTFVDVFMVWTDIFRRDDSSGRLEANALAG
jgi:hypothetical protein